MNSVSCIQTGIFPMPGCSIWNLFLKFYNVPTASQPA